MLALEVIGDVGVSHELCPRKSFGRIELQTTIQEMQAIQTQLNLFRQLVLSLF